MVDFRVDLLEGHVLSIHQVENVPDLVPISINAAQIRIVVSEEEIKKGPLQHDQFQVFIELLDLVDVR